MVRYKVPDECFFRIHHIRPRFKNDVENVLIFMAVEINKIPESGKLEFMQKVNNAIRRYPGNEIRKDKTINNWRTEISSLFGLIECASRSGECCSSAMSNNLTKNQDLVEFFKYFLFYFQYPGGHLKPHETLKYLQARVNFKAAKYILSLLSKAEEVTQGRFGITKAELAHCVFNDLRVTRDGRPVEEVVDLIRGNRANGVGYDWNGDVIRYAGDILDYMVIANLVVLHGNKYYLNLNERESIAAFLESELHFDKYETLYEKPDLKLEDVNALKDDWFHYVNQRIETAIFRTNLFKYLNIDESLYSRLPADLDEFVKKLKEKGEVMTKEVGDIGEYLVHGHECMKLKNGGREDLIQLVKRIPSAFGMGFDISSVELDGKKRLIEVKTTISSSKISFTSFHFTPSEWKAAESYDGRYFVYRLMVSKDRVRLFIIQDPVGKYKSDGIQMTPGDGAEISFSEDAGNWQDLLIWKN
jgi:hypothetical protein